MKQNRLHYFLLVGAGLLPGILSAQPFVYVSGFGSNDLSLIQPATNTFVGTIPVGAQPGSMAVRADGSRLFVVNQNSNSLSVILTANSTNVDEIPVRPGPFAVAVTPDGGRAYVTYPAENRVVVYDVRSKREWAQITVDSAYRIAMHPQGSRVYVTSANGRYLQVVDTRINRVIGMVPVGHTGTGIAVAPHGRRIYVSTQFPGPNPDQGPGAIWAVDTETNRVAGSLRGSFGDALAVSRDGRRVYGINEVGLATIDARAFTLLKSTPLPVFANSIGVAPSGPNLYLAFPLENLTRVLDTASDSVVATIPTGTSPTEVAVAAPSVRPGAIYPLGCLRRSFSGSEAVFSYFNENPQTEIPVGTDNRFAPAPQNRGQVTVFNPGLSAGVFRLPFDGNAMTWFVTGPDGEERSATVSRTSVGCPF